MSYKNWECPKCGHRNTKFTALCESSQCWHVRGYFRWMLNWDNPWVYLLLIPIGIALYFVFT